MRKIFFLFLIVTMLAVFVSPVKAQATPEQPVYVVSSGDTLTTIAARFGISVNDLIAANSPIDPNALAVGMQLIIPGLDGIQGILEPSTVTLGDTYFNLLRKYQLSENLFIKLNHITSPSQIYVGSPLVLPQKEAAALLSPTDVLKTGETLLELSARRSSNPWNILSDNHASSSSSILPGEVIFGHSSENTPATSLISPNIDKIEISPLPLIQGETTEIKIFTHSPQKLSGNLLKHDLVFFESQPNQYVALQGVYRMTTAGIYPITISGDDFSFEQMILVSPRVRIEDPRLPVDPITTDVTITGPEDELVKGHISQVSDSRQWSDLFKNPIDVPKGYEIYPDCTTDLFGNLRAYNDGPFNFYHTGLDLSACGNNLNIYASAPGTVVVAQSLTVRGNYTLIDHGWGIFSGYGHQSELKVKVGDKVETGQLIGLIGATGRVTGPHLHWEVWVNGVQVDPLDWLKNTYP